VCMSLALRPLGEDRADDVDRGGLWVTPGRRALPKTTPFRLRRNA
jgi:hypothetical protein